MAIASVHLAPQQNVKVPLCENYNDLAKVIDFEKRVRTFRARTEPYQINHITKSVFGTFEIVAGNSSNLYFVDIFDNKKRHDTCTCKDFCSNFLNVCKHIEAVYLGLSELGLAKEYGDGVKKTSPYLTFVDGKVLLVGKDPTVVYSDGEIIDYTQSASLRVASLIPDVIEKTKRVQAKKNRTAKTEADIAAGNVKIDVLLKPLFPYQIDCVKQMVGKGRLLLALRMGGGKAQPLSAKILTPSGWVTMGEIKIGDSVVGSNGKPTTVTGIFPQGEKEIFRVTFSDNSVTECCKEHLWLTQTWHERNKTKTSSVKTLEEISKNLLFSEGNPNQSKNHSIPLVKPVEFLSKSVSLDPYLLGCLIGDGSFRGASVGFSTKDHDLVRSLQKTLPLNCHFVKQKNNEFDYRIYDQRANVDKQIYKYTYNFSHPVLGVYSFNSVKKFCALNGFKPSAVYDAISGRAAKLKGWEFVSKEFFNDPNLSRNSVISELKKLGLHNHKSETKFIPTEYKFNDFSTRLAVLQGLMDTDGYCSKNGVKTIFYSTSKELATDVQFLVQSFGGVATINNKQTSFTHKGVKKLGLPSYVVQISLPPEIVPFRLERKLNRFKPKTTYKPTRYITDVSFIGLKDAKCISVDAEDHLYVTDNFIVTHNTASAICTCEVLRATDQVCTVLLVVPASLKQQWANEIEAFSGVKAEIVHKTDDFRGFEPHAIGAPIQYKIVNYELLLRAPELLQTINPDVIICDEAQKIKNFRSKTADAIKQINSRFLFALTGTPIENRLDDLYSIVQLIDEDLFGPLWKFNFDFHEQDAECGGKIVACKNLHLLRDRIKDHVFSKNRADILAQMPPLFEEVKFVAMGDDQAECEEGYRHEAAKLFAKAASKGLTRGEQQMLSGYLLKARQACDSLALCEPDRNTDIFESPKLDELKLLVEEICVNDKSKVVIFSEWVEMLSIIAKMLDTMGVGHVTLHGGIQTKKRPPIISQFETDDSKLVLLASDAGGTGLNLQFASYVIHFDLPWNPAKLDQRTARTHRLGQKNKVYAYYLCAETGIERGIKDVLVSKRDVRTATLEADSLVEEVELQSFVDYLKENTDMFEAPVEEIKAVPAVLAEPPKPKIDTRVRQIIDKMTKFTAHQKANKHKEAITEAHDILLLLIGFLQKLDQHDYDTVIKLMPKRLMGQGKAYVEAHGVLVSLHHFINYKGDIEKLGQIYLRTTILRARKAIDSLLNLL